MKYQYHCENHTYNSEHSFLAKDMKENIDSATVYYNSFIPSLSVVKGIPNPTYKQRLYLVYICVSFFFFLFTFYFSYLEVRRS